MQEKMEKKIFNNYKNMVEKKSPNSDLIIDCIWAFVVGGLICDIGQFFTNIFSYYNTPKVQTSSWVAAIMVFLGAFLTGLGLYDDIGKRAGAGSIVPITGFANSIVSPAMEFKREGYVFGVGGKMFTIAGPVLVFGISASILAGLIHYFMDVFIR